MPGKQTQYQPISRKNQQVSDAKEVHYNQDFKAADIAGGYRRAEVKAAKREDN
ncbi:YfhE family protein [Tuberibacillus sp. Marseille-P3662]|uniref:YfhE family protein n=1 Tax=Tuberibacillus sp. Marseille-P3662 TaxID=1965358 RepID=UPI000A1CBC26|nr:YfhE family protein [Tuberibacillus sp. Marseille-P3662]